VFTEESTQSEVFEGCGLERLAQRALKGYNVSVFAYGQTGAGKTHTMEGFEYDSMLRPVITKNTGKEGVVPRMVQEVFRRLAMFPAKDEFIVFASFLQIYKEKVFDLLQGGKKGLKMRWSRLDGFYVEGLSVRPCSAEAEVMGLYYEGLGRKAMASHNMNKASSRSHCVLTLSIQRINTRKGVIVHSKIHLVDLAGSERISATGNQEKSLQESITINKSLFALRQVITALALHCNHVPYRESKLTSLLKQSIGGNSHCLMIACISPLKSQLEETLSTLNYSSKTSGISNSPIKNLDPKSNLVQSLQREIQGLKKKLNSCYEKIVDLEGCEENNIEVLKCKLEESMKMTDLLIKENTELKEILLKNEEEKRRMKDEIEDLNWEKERLREENEDLKVVQQLNKPKIKKLTKENEDMWKRIGELEMGQTMDSMTKKEIKQRDKKEWGFKSKRTIVVASREDAIGLEKNDSFARIRTYKTVESNKRPKSTSGARY
jgi:hypothetical protein